MVFTLIINSSGRHVFRLVSSDVPDFLWHIVWRPKYPIAATPSGIDYSVTVVSLASVRVAVFHHIHCLVIWRVSVKDGARGVGVGEDFAKMWMNDEFPGHGSSEIRKLADNIYAGSRRLVWRLLIAWPQVIHLGRQRLVAWRVSAKERAW
jgi:hypothetical protein